MIIHYECERSTLAAEYAFVLRPMGRLYIATDVEELYKWMMVNLQTSPMFREAMEEERGSDALLSLIGSCTEESKKASREGRAIWSNFYVRL